MIAGRVRNSLSDARTSLFDFVANGILGNSLVLPSLRVRALRMLGMRLGRCRIKARVFFGSGSISVGDGSFVNHACFFDGSAPITIGRNCSLGYQVMLIASTHAIGASSARAGTDEAAPVTIGDGVWVGARATILAGVSVGSGCIIAAGAVVTTDCEPDGLYAGVPARRVKNLATARPMGGPDDA